MHRIRDFVILAVMTVMLCGFVWSQKDVSYENIQYGPVSDSFFYQQDGVGAEEENTIDFTILGNETLSIEESRIDGMQKIDDRWTPDEVDAILDSLTGTWRVGKYIGFVSGGIYFPDLWDPHDNIDPELREQLWDEYRQKQDDAQNTIPEFTISIREGGEVNEAGSSDDDYILVNDDKTSFKIVLSMYRGQDIYPIYINQTTVSGDFFVEYPVMYLMFSVSTGTSGDDEYTPATLVISSDDKFYLLIHGAFYSLVEAGEAIDETDGNYAGKEKKLIVEDARQEIEIVESDERFILEYTEGENGR